MNAGKASTKARRSRRASQWLLLLAGLYAAAVLACLLMDRPYIAVAPAICGVLVGVAAWMAQRAAGRWEEVAAAEEWDA